MDDEDDIDTPLVGGGAEPEPEADEGAAEGPQLDEGLGDEGEDEGQPEVIAKPIGRAERAVLAAKRDAREAKEEAERTRRELDELRRQQAERRENPAEEQARLAAMDPEERLNYRIEKLQSANTQAYRNLEMSFKEQADKASFAVQLAQTPSLKRYEAKVEAIYAEHMAQAKRNGTALPDRDTILTWVMGQSLRANAAKAVDKGRKTGAANIARQTTRPVSARGDVSASGGRGKSAADRLADVTF